MRCLAFQHTPGEPPAAFASHAAAAGDTLDVVKLYDGQTIPDFDEHDTLLVMGGPMDVWDEDEHPWLATEKAAIRDWVSTGKPYLGICLGHQLLIEALGGSCRKMPVPEIAIADVSLTDVTNDPILSTLPQSFPAMHWHGVEADVLPQDTTTLGFSSGCDVQAVRHKTTAWGLQFHPEIEPGTLTSWMQDAGNLAGAASWLGSEDAAWDFVRDGEARADQFLTLSRQIYAAFRRQAV